MGRTDQADCDHEHLANDGFEAFSFEADKPFATDKFQRFLEQVLDNIFGAKGVLWIDDSDQRYVFHLVGKRFTFDRTGWSAPMKNRLVLIGRNLDHGRMRDRLEGCLSDCETGAEPEMRDHRSR